MTSSTLQVSLFAGTKKVKPREQAHSKSFTKYLVKQFDRQDVVDGATVVLYLDVKYYFARISLSILKEGTKNGDYFSS